MMMNKAIAFFLCLPLVASAAEIEPFAVREGVGNFVRKAESGETVRVAYLGGSITEMAGWRNLTTAAFSNLWPKATFVEIPAGVGGTGSSLGVYRLGHDVLAHDPDLVFVEFAVNDRDVKADNLQNQYDGIVRQIWMKNPRTDIVFVYTLTECQFDDYRAGKVPNVVTATEELVSHYGIPSVTFGPTVLKGLAAAPKERFAPDGVHPAPFGHGLYRDAVVAAFEAMRNLKGVDHSPQLARPFAKTPLDDARMLPITKDMLDGEWRLLGGEADAKRVRGLEKFRRQLGEVWEGAKPGCRLHFRFRGTVVQVYDVIGPDGGQVFLTVDGKRKGPYSRFDAYCWYHRPQVLYVGCMESGIHDVVIEVAETQPDRTIVGKKDEDVKSAKYDGTVFRPGAILLRGEIVND